MRKLILSLLLASVATAPAVAQRSDRADRAQARAEREEAREEREAREDRQDAREVRQPREDRQQVREVGADRSPRASVDAASRAQVRADGRADRRPADQIRAVRQAPDSVRAWQGADRQQLRQQRLEGVRKNRQLRQADRTRPPVLGNRTPVISQTPQPGTQPPARAKQRRYSPTRWSGDWRRNSRYDWYNYRDRYRSLFRLGLYSDPFGWGYQPYSIGWRMWPNYYRSSFWLNDPWQYRLPYAPAGTRWVRYYNDAILVDTWDGQVVDVIYNFFW